MACCAGSCSEIPTLLPLTICYCVRPRNATPQAVLNCVNFPHRRIIRPYLEFENYKILELCLRNGTNLLINNLLLQWKVPVDCSKQVFKLQWIEVSLGGTPLRLLLLSLIAFCMTFVTTAVHWGSLEIFYPPCSADYPPQCSKVPPDARQRF
ncbi:hypothetical protein T05_15551 [Trichinella murrelli]|uniref:Uncharacterized protein n=1 Tax=Trichinella murrelli TaxID=144512 RepID=A0A0V0TQY8_9BILA|nr:hypothetical protein T05_15551 [Trichinella murrelli]